MRFANSINKKEQLAVNGTWKPPIHRCECGKLEKDCDEVMRHYMKALIEWCLKDPRWVDPAPFPVPKDAVPWVGPSPEQRTQDGLLDEHRSS